MKNKFKHLRPTLVLLGICVVVAGALAITKHFTATSTVTDPDEIIEQNRENYLEVLPGDENFEFIYRSDDYEKNTAGVVVEAVKSSAGYAITVHSAGQYASSPMHVLVGISNEGTVTGIKVLEMSETPGLGAKAAEPAFLNQYTGGSLFSLDGSSGTKINAITGATRSSRAVTNAVNQAIEEFARLSGGNK